MKRTGLLIIIFIICFARQAKTQQQRLDSLLRAEKNYPKEDSGKVILLIDIMKEYRKLKQSKERFQYAESVTALGEKINFLRLLHPVYNAKGLHYEGLSDFEKSIANYTRGIELAELIGDKGKAADYTLNYGTVYHLLADYPQALTLYLKAANYYISIGSENDAANCFINMGGVYNEFTNQHEKALEFINKALVIFQKKGSDEKRGVCEAFQSIATSYLHATPEELLRMHIDPAKRFSLVRQFLLKAINMANEINEADLQAAVITKMGEVDEKELNYNSAINQFKSALAIYKQLDKKNYVFNEMLNMGRVYQKQNDINNSLDYLQKALAGGRQLKVPDIQKDALFLISNIYENLHRFDSAYTYYQQFIVMRDSISNTEKQKEFTRKQLQFEFGIKERDYKLNQQIADDKIKQQDGIAIQQRQELSLRNKQLELTNREKEIQKLNYLKKQSELEADQKLKISMLNQKDLERKLATNARDEKIIKQQLQIKFDRNLTLFMGLMLLLLTCAGFFVYSAKQRTAKLNKLVSTQKEELEEMGNAKDKIFSIVSHDMRAPVNNLIAFSSLLENGDIDQDRLALYIEQIKGTLDHTSSLMENMLNWAASQMQGFTPVIEDVDITPIVTHTLKGVEQALLKKKIILTNAVTGKIFVRGDKNMVELIIRNLVSNAVKFSNQGGRLDFFSQQQDSTMILSVTDNGVGMSADKVALINSGSTYSLQSTAGTKQEKGTGLGLMLCKHFAVMMGGNISAESSPGKGSVFAIHLPAVTSA